LKNIIRTTLRLVGVKNFNKKPVSDDLNNFLAQDSSEAYAEGFVYAMTLPAQRQIALGRTLLKNEDLSIVYRGCQLLLVNKHEKETFPSLARIIIEEKNAKNLSGREFAWIHSNDSMRSHKIMVGIMEYMQKNYLSYSSQQKKNCLNFFKSMGCRDVYDKKAVALFIKDFKRNRF
jgi:hypothetical protein